MYYYHTVMQVLYNKIFLYLTDLYIYIWTGVYEWLSKVLNIK